MRIVKTPTAVTPRYTDNGSAGMDLYVDTALKYELQPGETYHLPTGIRVEIPRTCFGVIYPQPNMHKKGLTLANTVGIINSSDRGEIILAVKNIFSDVIRINGQWGLRIPLAQLIIQPYRFEKIEVEEAELSTFSHAQEFAKQLSEGMQEGFSKIEGNFLKNPFEDINEKIQKEYSIPQEKLERSIQSINKEKDL